MHFWFSMFNMYDCDVWLNNDDFLTVLFSRKIHVGLSKNSNYFKWTGHFLWTSFICKVNFFPPNFSFVFWKREFWREKIYFAKKVIRFFINIFHKFKTFKNQKYAKAALFPCPNNITYILMPKKCVTKFKKKY
jgi:hypothetical protein